MKNLVGGKLFQRCESKREPIKFNFDRKRFFFEYHSDLVLFGHPEIKMKLMYFSDLKLIQINYMINKIKQFRN